MEMNIDKIFGTLLFIILITEILRIFMYKPYDREHKNSIIFNPNLGAEMLDDLFEDACAGEAEEEES